MRTGQTQGEEGDRVVCALFFVVCSLIEDQSGGPLWAHYNEFMRRARSLGRTHEAQRVYAEFDIVPAL